MNSREPLTYESGLIRIENNRYPMKSHILEYVLELPTGAYGKFVSYTDLAPGSREFVDFLWETVNGHAPQNTKASLMRWLREERARGS